ncbi:MAG TPA: LysR family transcriptional regulator [Candidatus Scatomorpha merdigallinarum]|nr:LysR family transcriptional regulator [Candidatus Scatomorpha merdigallinarum]
METKKIFAFIETVRIGSINKAAVELGYTQSGLTYILNTLEDDLGIKLLSRGHSGITLTPEGQELYPLLERLVDCEIAVNERLALLKSHYNGVIRIAAYSSLMVSWLPEVLRSFHKLHPDVKFEIRTSVLNMKKWLDEDAIDIALCEKHVVEGYNWQYIFDDEMWVAAHESLPICSESCVTLEMLRPYPIIFPNINPKNVVSLKLEELGIRYERQTDLYTEDGSITLSMVQQNRAVSFVTRMYSLECPENVRFIPLEPPIKRGIGVAVGHTLGANKLVRSFIATMKRTQPRYK